MQLLTKAHVQEYLDLMKEELGKADLRVLNNILPLFEAEKANMKAVIEKAFPEKVADNSTEDYKSFRYRFNNVAKSLNLKVSFVVDGQKIKDTSKRQTWFEGESLGTRKILIANEKGTVSLNKDQYIETEIKPTREYTQIFVSHAKADEELVLDFCNRVEIESKNHNTPIKFWMFQKEMRGLDNKEIDQQILDDGIRGSDYCLLCLSPDFIASTYIQEKEIPLIQEIRNGRSNRIMLRSVDIDASEVKKIISNNYVLGFNKPYESLNEQDRQKFTRTYCKEIVEVIGNKGINRINKKLINSIYADKNELARLELEGIPLRMHHIDVYKNEEERNKGYYAIDYLEKWLEKEDTHYFALLGEYGTGKTWTSMMFAIKMQEKKTKNPKLATPIYLDLRHFNRSGFLDKNKNPKLDEIILHILDRTPNIDKKDLPSVEDIKREVQERKGVIIFDGLDEISTHLENDSQRNALIQELWNILPKETIKNKNTESGLGKVIITCRDHHFRTFADWRAGLTGQHRSDIDTKDYETFKMKLLSVEQIKEYLQKNVEDSAISFEEAWGIIDSTHNLKELGKRPFSLWVIVRQLQRLEEKIKLGEVLTALSIYEVLIEDWLGRDSGKHIIPSEYKEGIMQELAAYMWRHKLRALPYKDLTKWLDELIEDKKHLRSAFSGKSRDIIKADLRTATFIVRSDAENFRFAHSSIQEYFLAAYLHNGLQNQKHAQWDMPSPSIETWGFLGQILNKNKSTSLVKNFEIFFKEGNTKVRQGALDYWIFAIAQGYPPPKVQTLNFVELDISGKKIRSIENKKLFWKGADFSKTNVSNASFYQVNLDLANFTQGNAIGAAFQSCNLSNTLWDSCNVQGATFRHCGEAYPNIEKANAHLTSLIPLPMHSELKPLCLMRDHTQHTALALDRYGIDTKANFFTGHTDRVFCCSYSADGRHIVSGSYDTTLKIWEMESGECVQTLEGHTDSVSCCSYSADGRHIVSGSDDKTLKIWEVESGECVQILEGHTASVSCCSYSADGRHIVSGSYDKTLKIWEVESGECVQTLEGHTNWVFCCSYSADGRHIVSGSLDTTLKIWEVESGECVQTLEGHTDWVSCCSYSADGRHIVSGSLDTTLKIWEVESGECVQTLEGHTDRVFCCSYSADGRHIVSGSYDKTLKIWEVESGECVQTLEGHTASIRCCSYSADGRHIVSGSLDKTLKIWEVESGECVQTLEGHTDRVFCCSYSADGRHIVSGSYDKTLKIWEVESGECVQTLEGHTHWVSCCSYSAEGRHIVSGSDDKTLKIWEVESGECVQTLEGHTHWVSCCSYSAEGRHIVSGSYDKTLKIWEVESGECVQTLEGHTHWVSCCSYSAEGRHIVSGSDDKTLKIWEVESGECVQTLEGHTASIRCCSYSADGRRIVSGSDDKTLKIWEVESGECVQTLEGHTASIRCCSYSAEGRHIVSGSYDKTLKIWEVESGECVQTLEGHTASVSCCSYSADGKHIVSGSLDTALKIWDAESGVCLKTMAHLPNGNWGTIDEVNNEIISASEEAWRWMGYSGYNKDIDTWVRYPSEK